MLCAEAESPASCTITLALSLTTLALIILLLYVYTHSPFLIMASKIIGLTVLTNPRTPVANPHVVFFDANFWLADGIQLLGCLRYYNRSRVTFDDVEPIPCVIDASVRRASYVSNGDNNNYYYNSITS